MRTITEQGKDDVAYNHNAKNGVFKIFRKASSHLPVKKTKKLNEVLIAQTES